jgi:cyclohexanecarboxylate-CoA ligase
VTTGVAAATETARGQEGVDQTLWGMIERRAQQTPDWLMAVDEHGDRLTFGQFHQAALRAAAGFHQLGVTEGTPVSWQLPNWLRSLVLVGALSRLGAVQNPLVPIYREREVGFIVGQTKAEVLVVPSVWRGFDYEAMARAAIRDLPTDTRVVVADGPLPDGDPSILPDHQPITPDGTLPVRWIYYTSGSTSRPKGAMHTDGTLGAAAYFMVERVQMVPADRCALVFPFSHIGGANFMFSGLIAGCSYICVEAFDPVTTVEVLSREGVTLAGGATPIHAAYLAAQRRQPDVPIFPHVRAYPGGAAPKPPGLHYDLVREVGGVGIVSGYGLTECPVLAMSDVTSPTEKLANSEGRPAPETSVTVVGLDGATCQANEEGEFRVQGPQLFVGYVDSSLDEAAFDEQGYFRTGDLGYLDEDGYVVITGRLKDVIVRKGENISAKEVEDLLYRHPKVAEVAVIGLPDPASGERCCAVVVLEEGVSQLTLRDVADFLRQEGLMNQKLPEQLELVTSLPKAPAGKVLKQELRDRFAPAE